MTTGVEKAADRLQSVHNLHLLICLIVAVFAAVGVFDADYKKTWVSREQLSVKPLLRHAQVNIALLREELFRTYGMPERTPYFDSEAGRVNALITDIYLANEYVRLAHQKLIDTSYNDQFTSDEFEDLVRIVAHLDFVGKLLAYGTGTAEQELRLVNSQLGTLGEPQSLSALTLEDLARLGYAASVSPRSIVRALSSLVKSKEQISPAALRSLIRWVGRSEQEIREKRPIRAQATKLWTSWILYATQGVRRGIPRIAVDQSADKIEAIEDFVSGFAESLSVDEEGGKVAEKSAKAERSAKDVEKRRQIVAALTAEDEGLRKLKSSLSSTQSIEDLYRQLTIDPDVHPLSSTAVKIPGLEVDLRFRYLFIVLPWIIAILLVFKYATVHQINLIAKKSPDKLYEMQGEVAGVLPFYRWTGRLSWIVSAFVIVSEIASIAILPALGLWFLATGVAIPGPWWFWLGIVAAAVVWGLYITELVSTRRELQLT